MLMVTSDETQIQIFADWPIGSSSNDDDDAEDDAKQKNEIIFYQQNSRLSRSAPYANGSGNVLRLNIQ